MSESQKNIIFVVAALVIICIFGGVIGVILQSQEDERLRNTFGEQIINICVNNTSTTSPSFQQMPRTALKLLVLEGASESSWHDDVPDEMRAETREELNVLACVAAERDVFLERCPYEDNVYIDRYARGHTVTLYNPDSARPITSFEVHGSPPGRCEDYTFADVGEVKTRRGDRSDGDAFMLAFRAAVGQ